MKPFFTRAKIKTSYELLLCVDAGKGRYAERVERGKLFKREQNQACYKEFQARNYDFSLRE